MCNKSLKNLVLAGLALGSAYASAQTYPMEFNVAPALTNVDTNSTFFIDIVARSTDGLNHPLSLAELLVKWTPSLFVPLDGGTFDPWYVPQNGFNMVFPPLPINADGSQIGVYGGTNPISPVNITITPLGLSVMKLRFTSLSSVGTGNLDLPASYETFDFLIQYNDSNGVQTVYGQNLAGLNGGRVVVGPVPEPSSLIALGLGAFALLRFARARR